MRHAALTFLIGLSAAFVVALGGPALASAASSTGAASAVACPSAGGCVAVGTISQTNGAQQGLLIGQTSNAWSADQLLALPKGANADPGVALNDLWCAKGPSCVAVGSYTDGAGNQQALVVNEKNGAWKPALKVTLPAGAIAGGSQLAELTALWCSSASSCVAVGDYTDNQGNQQGMALRETNGSWGQASATPVPANADDDPSVELTALDCTAVTSCDAMGIYDDQDGNQEGEILVGSVGNWGNGEATLPDDAAPAAQNVQINSLACGAAATCVGVGAFVDDSGNQQPLIIFANGDSFSTLEPQLPANADFANDPDTQLTSVSCPSAGNCTTVGDYDDANANEQGLMLSQSGGNFGQGVELTLPSDANQSDATANPAVQLNAVWCASAGSCEAVGAYTNVTQAEVPLSTTQSNGTWGAASAISLPSGAAVEANQTATLTGLACVSLSSCSAVGSFTSAAGDSEPLLSSSTSGGLSSSIVPAAPPTTTQLRKSLSTLTAKPAKATVKAATRHALKLKFVALAPGTVTLKWVRRGDTVASAKPVTVTKPGTVIVTLKLTTFGRRAATIAPTGWSVRAIAAFTPAAPSGASALSASHSFSLR